ncbi:MAG: TetR/AcrR family transcriptional regulator [Proteobacteria bacterium]|nr:TetR/AcrR family transcriptional regulator [Pseudomonadota bacterium]
MSDPVPRWRRRKKARPQEILEAALDCFSAKGFAATRMDDIAERAGVTKGTIYLYFQNKEAVFKALVRESIGTQIGQVLEQTQAFQGPAANLLRMVISTVGQILSSTDRVVLPKIIVAEAGNFPELARFYREEIIDKGLGVMSAVIARGIERGEFRKVDPQHAARLCVAPVLLAAVWRTTFAQFDAAPYDYSGFLQTHLDVLLRGLAPDGDAPP